MSLKPTGNRHSGTASAFLKQGLSPACPGSARRCFRKFWSLFCCWRKQGVLKTDHHGLGSCNNCCVQAIRTTDHIVEPWVSCLELCCMHPLLVRGMCTFLFRTPSLLSSHTSCTHVHAIFQALRPQQPLSCSGRWHNLPAHSIYRCKIASCAISRGTVPCVHKTTNKRRVLDPWNTMDCCGCLTTPPPPCISYALVQATVGVGTVLIWYRILVRYQT